MTLRATTYADFKAFFSGVDQSCSIDDSGPYLKQIGFGDYLVEQRAITRAELFQALELQAQYPNIKLGECIAALGLLPLPAIEAHAYNWQQFDVVEV